MKSIVVGVDGSAPSWRSLAVAVDLARHYQGRVHACFVWALTATEERAGFSAAPVSAPEGGREGEDLGTQVLKTLHDAGAMGDFTQREGEIARELESLAAITAAQLIVVGRSHHPALHLGGVPRHLLAGGERLVLVVP